MTISVYGLGYGVCTADCETAAPVWSHQVVERPDDLQVSDPVPPKPGCQSLWLDDGLSPSLALDSAKPRVAYTAAHYQGITCAIQNDIQLVRFGLNDGSAPILHVVAYLPLLR